jgi:hypothetical protein
MKKEKESYRSLDILKEPISLAFWTKVSDRIGHGTIGANGTNEEHQERSNGDAP